MASIYEAGPSSSSSVYSGHRIPPANGSSNYQRPPLSRRRSPSPPPYHRYSPRQSTVYDPHYYQRQPPPTWSGAFDSQSATPDRYAHDSRESRPRSDSWKSHTDSRWENDSAGRKDTVISTPRMFEPSDSWKKTHDDQNVPALYNPRRSPERPLPSSPRADRRRVSDGYYRRPQVLLDDLPARYDSYRPTYDGNSSSAASSRAQSIGRRRSSPPMRGRPWPSKSRSQSPRRRSYSISRSSSQRRSSSRSRPSSPRSRTISRLPRRQGTPSPRPFRRRTTRSVSRSPSVASTRTRSRSRSRYSGRRRSASRGRSRSRSVRKRSSSPNHLSAPASRSDSIASSRASPPPSAPIVQVPVKASFSRKSASPVPIVTDAVEKVHESSKDKAPLVAAVEQQPTPPLDEEFALSAARHDAVALDHPTDNTGLVPSTVHVENGTDPKLHNSSLSAADSLETIQADGEAVALVTVKQEAVESVVVKEEVDLSSAVAVVNSLLQPDIRPQPELRPPTPVVDFSMEDIPNSSSSQSLGDALRVTVMTRILCDRQTREERVEPIIRSNLALLPAPSNRPLSTPDQVVTEFAQGPRAAQIAAAFYSNTRDLLKRRLNEREVTRLAKIKHLQEQYLELNERWKAHCRLLEGQSKGTPLLELESLNSSGRTTRRTATLGDAVRSDLEMEQIIASLGNDEATDPTFLSSKNHADIPDMISVEHGIVECVYDDSNLLVENAGEYYRPRTGMDDWTKEERQIFLDQFAAHPKQFGIIADALPHKTAAQCVAFYYLHKKRSIDFRDVVATHAPKRRRRRTGKQKANALLADIRQHDAEVSRDNEVTGTGRAKRRAATRRPLLDDLVTATPTPEPEGRSKRRRAPGAKSNLAEEVDDDDEEDAKPAKKARKTRKVKSAAIIEESLTPEGKSVDPNDISQRRKPSVTTSRWCDDDKQLFLELLGQHGGDFKRIAAAMPNQTTVQVSNFYKAHCEDMGLKDVAARAARRSSSPDRERVASVLNTLETEKLPFHYMPMPMPPNAAGMYSLALYAPPPGLYMHPAYGPPYPPYVNFPYPNASPHSHSSNPVPSNAS